MSYKTPPAVDDENVELPNDLASDDELLFEQDTEETEFSNDDDVDASLLAAGELLASKKSKVQPKTFSLQARRAIEDHLEQRRLQKELDYLYDDTSDKTASSKN